ncbi:hypothetical protein GQ53DRAFT_706811 [Thozetella sp. PMI_491]|nr:hypothetical protein GQ53DRAFT_706811 [Thozetella sp. PMI_491]
MITLKLLAYFAAISLRATAALAQSCNATDSNNKCPLSSPCCAYPLNTTGTALCGVGAACLIGCHPVASFSPGACAPVPVCQSQATVKTESFISIGDYLGDPNSADWIYSGQTPLSNDPTNATLTLPADGNRTAMLWPRYLWYGNIKMMVRLKAFNFAGIELYDDFSETFGFRFLGSPNTNITALGTSSSKDSGVPALGLHALELDWTPDKISWIVNGQTVFTKNRTDAKWNSLKNSYIFPQTPAQLYIFIERNSAASGSDGVIEVSKISIECFNATSPPRTNLGVSYSFADASGSNQSIIYGNRSTVLANTSATGLDIPTTNASSNSTDGSGKSSTATTNIPRSRAKAGIVIGIIVLSLCLAL